MSVNAPLILSVSPTNGSTSLTTVSDELAFSGSAVAGSTVTIYNGSIVLGTVTANAQGNWFYSTTSPLSDGAHAFTATATVSGTTSAQSTATNVTINSDISSFSPITDQWHAPISVDGSPYFVENANINGNAPWAITEINDHTLQFTLKPGDTWQDNDSSRSEIGGNTLYAANSQINVSYQLTVQPGAADSNLDWLILGQIHADDNSPIVQSLNSDYPVLAFHLTSATGHKGGDYLAIQGFYLPSGAHDPQSVTSANNGYLYLSPTPIVRGSSYSIQMTGSFQDNANGFVDVWINGVQVVNYHGPIGYGSSNYWKEGVYEGYTQTQPITVDYANTIVSSGPISSGPVTVANYLANQTALDASGPITISDTAINVDSAIATINADVHVSAITLLGTLELDLTVAQALNDTRALGVITNSSYGITIDDTATRLNTLTTTQIAQLKTEHVNELHATDADLTLPLAQRKLLGSDSITVLQPFPGGGTELITYNASGGISIIDYEGLIGRSYTSVVITYGSNGKPASAIYNTGLTETWTYNADNSYVVNYSNVPGQAYTSYSVNYGANNKPISATYSNGLAETWNFNADGSYLANFSNVVGQVYTSYSVNYGVNGKPINATYSNGMTEIWSYNADNSLIVTWNGITGRNYTSEQAVYNSAGARVAITTDQSSSVGGETLYISGLTISDAASSLGVTVGTDTFALNPHTNETINANGFGSEIFSLGSGFGHQTIVGFQAGSDTLSLGLSMFNGLSSTNTSSQNAAILMSNGEMVQSGTAVNITDITGDKITLNGETTTALMQAANTAFKFT